MDWITSPEAWAALVTLTVMEIVLGIDNVIFISVLVQRVAPAARDRTRTIGLLLAMGMRIVLLLSVSWLASLTEPVVTLFDHPFSWRDLILLAGGLFLI
jgi:predicted tellurium resistance membrane protein TerC